MYSALSGPNDWILRYIKTTFTFTSHICTVCLFIMLSDALSVISTHEYHEASETMFMPTLYTNYDFM